MRRVCVFCGAGNGHRPDYRRAAESTGRLLASCGLGLVYGGGSVGLMGALADAALAAGGEVIGVIPEALATREGVHRGLSELHVVQTMHERKALMAHLADAFVALPGGFGTLDELFEVLTWAQLGLHRKPIGLLNVAGYFAPLCRMIEQATTEGLLQPEHAGLLLVEEEAEVLLERLRGARTTDLPRWIDETNI
ncbi:MAG: TIGR00730 family Rossman fold protein [Myxococcales bacterium]|nr:TIGR00730 family Rossman fold protein [Myxococcales bacterium]